MRSLSLEAVPAALPVIRAALHRAAVDAGMAASRVEEAAFAVTEACANVVVHAYPPSWRRHRRCAVLVDIASTREGLAVYVRDDGIGMSAPSGRRGLGLVTGMIFALADDVAFSTARGGGTCVRMGFGLRERAPEKRRSVHVGGVADSVFGGLAG